jgi:hypothetical protein
VGLTRLRQAELGLEEDVGALLDVVEVGRLFLAVTLAGDATNTVLLGQRLRHVLRVVLRSGH